MVPGSDGTLQIEWHINQFDLEIDVLAPYSVAATRYDCISGNVDEVELDTDFTILSEWISELGQVRIAEQIADEG